MPQKWSTLAEFNDMFFLLLLPVITLSARCALINVHWPCHLQSLARGSWLVHFIPSANTCGTLATCLQIQVALLAQCVVTFLVATHYVYATDFIIWVSAFGNVYAIKDIRLPDSNLPLSLEFVACCCCCHLLPIIYDIYN